MRDDSIVEIKQAVNTPRKQHLLANMMMIVTILLWGISFISIKIVVTEVPPVTLALSRFVIASVLLSLLLKQREPAAKVDKTDMARMALAGFLGITLYFCFENTGVKLTTAVNASLIVSVIPILAICLDVLFFRARLSPLKIGGIIIAVIGTYLAVTANGALDFNSANFTGNLFMVGAMLCWTFYTLVNKSLQSKYSGLCMTTYQTIIGTVLLVPLSLTEYQQWRIFSLEALCHILFLAVCCSALCYLLYMYVLKHLDVAVTTLYLNLVPVVGVVGGYFILGESVLPIQLIGGSLTLLAIVIMNVEQSRQLVSVKHRQLS